MLEGKLDMKDLGVADVILGIKIHRTPQGLALSQSHYIKKVLDKFKYMEFDIAKTPLDASFTLRKNEEPVKKQNGSRISWRIFLIDPNQWHHTSRGRVYLPQDELAQEGLGLFDGDIFAGRVADKWRIFMKKQIQRARKFFDEAEKEVTELSASSRWPYFLVDQWTNCYGMKETRKKIEQKLNETLD
ncbi:hypothetical protein CQW23_22630 [Capsicum baccatum]|uniref:15-cis-phytoene synthase n=1 Tax=Capsicum baccatum TaxID=33114 RepID=A0A2G2W1E0_CAPBA|nr:hypothetical protein CQW23_22630 [Capsicum baccatum]